MRYTIFLNNEVIEDTTGKPTLFPSRSYIRRELDSVTWFYCISVHRVKPIQSKDLPDTIKALCLILDILID